MEVHERLSAAQIIAKVAHEGLRPIIPRGCPWSDLMRNCWKQHPRERPGFSKILTILSAQYTDAKALLRQSQKDSTQPHPKPTEVSIGTTPNFPPRVRSTPNKLGSLDETNISEKTINERTNSSPIPFLITPIIEANRVTDVNQFTSYSDGEALNIETDSSEKKSLETDALNSDERQARKVISQDFQASLLDSDANKGGYDTT